MRVVMVSPHLPPDQAANALLPAVLARELTPAGVDVTLAGHLPSAATGSDSRGPSGFEREGEVGGDRELRSLQERQRRVVNVPRRGRGRLARTRVGAVLAAWRMAGRLRELVRQADLVHLHSNGLVIEVAGWLAERWCVPFVITLYGTDVWHYDSARHRRFARVVHRAAHRIFYSHGLLDFARKAGLAAEPASVIYAPVGPHFTPTNDDERRAARQALGCDVGPMLVTVKRLHPVAGHEDLLRAMTKVVATFPRAQLVLIGDGPLRSPLEQLAAQLGLGGRVHFLGTVANEHLARYLGAGDLFVLPSRLESWGTVMLEALACGTPVVATATAGAEEVHACFPDDVHLCERERPQALAEAVTAALATPRRVPDDTVRRLRERFSPAACAAQYRAVYDLVGLRRDT